jgi:hypothetical protein
MPFESRHNHQDMLHQGDSEDAWNLSAVIFQKVQMAIMGRFAGSPLTSGEAEGAAPYGLILELRTVTRCK